MTNERQACRDDLLRYINITAKKKLEWLFEMNKFSNRFATKKYRIIWMKLREAR